MAFWFYVEGDTVGPLDDARIRTLVGRGAIRLDTYCWTDGWTEWRRVSDATELVARYGEALKSGPARPRRSAAPVTERKTGRRRRGAAAEPVLAHLGQRLIAGGIDALLIALVYFGFAWLAGAIDPAALVRGEISMMVPRWLELITYLGIAAYYLLLMSPVGDGQTLGYAAMGLQLIDRETREPPQGGRLLVWYIGTWLAFIGWVWYFHTTERQMLHNIVSNTIVVRRPF